MCNIVCTSYPIIHHFQCYHTSSATFDKIEILPTTQSIIDFVAENKDAIGYGGFKTNDDIFYANVEGIEPSDKNAQNRNQE